jgi:predicted dehydrogenase
VATQDRDHVAPALAAMAAGYHVLLEKPMAVTEEDCTSLVAAFGKAGVALRICHVLRYTGFFSTIKRAIDEGLVGKVAAIRHSENVAYWHFAHSFVRGNWRNTATSSPLILAKSCHDLDVLCWLSGGRPVSVSSFGQRGFYRAENAPLGAPARCTDGCPHEKQCPWFAPRLYVNGTPMLQNLALGGNPLIRLLAGAFSTRPLDRLWYWNQWPASTIADDPSRAARLAALRTGPYGRCVYRCDNDVVDRQVVDMQFDNGIVASFSLHGFSYKEGRQIRVDGSAGSLEGSFGFEGQELTFFDHRRGGRKVLWRSNNPFKGHGGGDDALMQHFTAQVESLLHGGTASYGGAAQDDTGSAQAALRSHLVCFAAERSRLEGRVIQLQ